MISRLVSESADPGVTKNLYCSPWRDIAHGRTKRSQRGVTASQAVTLFQTRGGISARRRRGHERVKSRIEPVRHVAARAYGREE